MLINVKSKIKGITNKLWIDNYLSNLYNNLSFSVDEEFDHSKRIEEKVIRLKTNGINNEYLKSWEFDPIDEYAYKSSCSVDVVINGDKIRANTGISINSLFCAYEIDIKAGNRFYVNDYNRISDMRFISKDYEKFGYPELDFFMRGEFDELDDKRFIAAPCASSS